MKVIYTKTLLYAYPQLTALAKQIDRLVEKKALSSLSNCKSAMSQYEDVLQLTYEKDIIFSIKLVLEQAFARLSENDLKHLEFKFFRRRKKEFFEGFDTQTRNFYRRIIVLANRLSKSLEDKGFDNKFFEEKCLQMEFFRRLLKWTEKQENLFS